MDKRPTVILAAPFIYGLDQCIEKNLHHAGYSVTNLCFDERDTPYPNLGTRLIAQFHKRITGNTDYKKSLKYRRHEAEIARRLAPFGSRKADFALCINAHVYPRRIIAQIRERARFCVGFQWDGIGKFPDILGYLDLFDRMLVFDPADVEKYPQHRFQAASNFYFDYPLPEAGQPENGGIYFLGGYEDNRAQATETFLRHARARRLPLDFRIYCKDGRAQKRFGSEGVRYLDRSSILSFEENLMAVRASLAVADFVQYRDYGLSLRVFDALRFGKKLITTNQSVTRYDFYRPENIFAWDGKDLSGLENFLETPCQPVPEAVRRQYAFSTWIARAFAAA